MIGLLLWQHWNLEGQLTVPEPPPMPPARTKHYPLEEQQWFIKGALKLVEYNPKAEVIIDQEHTDMLKSIQNSLALLNLHEQGS